MFTPDGISPNVVAERWRLIQNNLRQAGFGYQAIHRDKSANQTGQQYDMVEQMYKAAGYTDFYFIDTSNFLGTIDLTP